MLGYSAFRFVALLGHVFHQIRPNAIVAIVRVVVVQTAVSVDIARIVRVAGVRGNRSFPKWFYHTPSGIGAEGSTGSAVSCSALYHLAVINLTSRVSFVQ